MKEIEPHLMSLLASRIGSIAIRMNNAMVKAARSSVLALCRDLSSAICDGNGDVLAFPAGFPAHVGGCTLTARSLLELQGDTCGREMPTCTIPPTTATPTPQTTPSWSRSSMKGS